VIRGGTMMTEELLLVWTFAGIVVLFILLRLGG
jgi:hypothetical protein